MSSTENNDNNQNVPRGTNLPARQDQFDQSLSPAEVERYCRLLDLEVENLTEGLVKSAWKKKLVAERDTIGRADDHDRVAEVEVEMLPLLVVVEIIIIILVPLLLLLVVVYQMEIVLEI